MKHLSAATLSLYLVLTFLFAPEATCLDFNGLLKRSAKSNVTATASFEVAFSPSHESEAAIVRFIGEAQASAKVAAYSFTSKEIASALVQAARRGVDVRVVVDKSQLGERYTAATFLANQGVPVRVDSRYAIQHQKVIIVDDKSVETGSYNFTASARDRNSENVLIIREVPSLAAQYARNWLKMWEESQPLSPRY